MCRNLLLTERYEKYGYGDEIMFPTAVKLLKTLQLAKNKGTQNIVKKITIALLSPVIAFVFLIGGIFCDGINFNHNLVNDLFNGVPVSTAGMSAEQAAMIQNIESGIVLINQQIEAENAEFADGQALDTYLVKGFYIGLMFTEQAVVLDEEGAAKWTAAFIVTEGKDKKKLPTVDASVVYKQIEESFSVTLTEETKASMQQVVDALRGNGSTSGTVTTLSKKEIEQLIKKLPKETSELRKNIIIQAADAVGKIPYYWGGAAVVPGYEGNDFGKPYTPDEHGRAFKGMDCSHFVDWVYWTVMNDNLGNMNTEGQIRQCSRIEKSQLLPGDLAFLMENGVTTHVGIYAGTNASGEAVWIHENADDNNVSMNTVAYWNVYCRLNIMKGR